MASYFGAGLQNIIPLLAGLGTIVQLLVLSSLVLASVVCWAIIFNKSRQLRRVQRYDRRFRRAFQSAQDFAFLAAAARRFSQSPMARLLRTAHRYAEVSSNGSAPGLSGRGLDRLRQTLDARLAVETGELEVGLPFLATTASVTPFIGLLGTVWGIIQSFHAVGSGRQRLAGRGGAWHFRGAGGDRRRLGGGHPRRYRIQLFPQPSTPDGKRHAGLHRGSSCRCSRRCQWQNPRCRRPAAMCRCSIDEGYPPW